MPISHLAVLIHGDPAPSNLGVQVLDRAEHVRVNLPSRAWEVANAWTAEPTSAHERLVLQSGDIRRLAKPDVRGSDPPDRIA